MEGHDAIVRKHSLPDTTAIEGSAAVQTFTGVKS